MSAYPGHTILTKTKLYKALVESASLFAKAFFVFDGLDEYVHKDPQDTLLLLLRELTQERIKIFITSRLSSGGVLHEALRDFPKIDLSAREEDLKLYVQLKLTENNNLIAEGEVRDKFVAELKHCWHGRFVVRYVL